jgi:chromosome segregation ATPase
MLMGSSVITPSTAELVDQARKLVLSDESQRVLDNIAAQLAALQDRQNEIIALQKQASDDRAAADKLMVELQQRSDALDNRDAALLARTAKFQATLAVFEQKLAAHEAAMEQVMP